MTDRRDEALRLAFAPLRDIEPTDEELLRVLVLERARHPRRRRLVADALDHMRRPRRRRLAADKLDRVRRWRRLAMGVLTLLVLAGGGAYAGPGTRAAVHGAFESLAPWVVRDTDRAPGRGITPADEVPTWLREKAGEMRVLARAGGAELIVSRGSGDTFSVALGQSYGSEGTVDDWRRFLGDHAVVLLGPADAGPHRIFDARWRRPLFGLAEASVARVELTYTSGSPTVDDHVDGGWGLLADTTRRLRALVAYGSNGAVIERRDLRGVDLRVCREVRGCPPGRLVPALRR